jgi:hypothetical protein
MELELGKKYKGRVFINMELPNDIYLLYHKNSTSGNIPVNHKTEWGFFKKEAIDYFLKYKKDNNDDSVIVYCSDIRRFVDDDAPSALLYNNIKNYNNIIALNIAFEETHMHDYTRDMDLQKEWYLDLKSDYGIFKFKMKQNLVLPTPIQYEYLDGDIIIQAWGPVTTTETRLFTSPDHKKTSYYNVKKYVEIMKTINTILRPALLGDVLLSGLNIKFDYNPNLTLNDIWKPFLPNNLIGYDAILETYIVLDYLKIYKDDIKHTDIMLVISDLTQTLMNRSDNTNILGWTRDINPTDILDSRKQYHDKFKMRLDFNSAKNDNSICDMDPNKKYTIRT